jgi:tetratricopeptide (TPR) repeat protein
MSGQQNKELSLDICTSEQSLEITSKGADSSLPSSCLSGSCPVCGELRKDSEEVSSVSLVEESVVLCPRCETWHHKECWDYNDGCAIYGCKASLILAREAAQIEIATNDEILAQRTVGARAKHCLAKSVHVMSLLSETHWYIGGVSLTAVSIMLLAKFIGMTSYGRIPYYAIIRTVAFHSLLLGFFILALARFLPTFLKSLGTWGASSEIKFPSDYTPKEIDALVTEECKNVNTLELAGFLHYSQGNFERARDLFKQALAIDDEHQNCTYQLGRCFAKLGELDTALKILNRGWEMNHLSGVGKKSKWWAELIEKRISDGEAEVLLL